MPSAGYSDFALVANRVVEVHSDHGKEYAVLGKSLILIVDDSPHGRETLRSLLSLPEYELAMAADGPEAIALAEQLIPDLILLDVMMPEMNGFEVCRHLRKHPRLSEVPVILVTALDDRESRLEGLDAGADDFISKPIDRAELRVRVRTVTRLNRYRNLLNERTRFEWVVEQANDGYLILDTYGKLLYANQVAQQLLELPTALTFPSKITLFELLQANFRCEPVELWQAWFDSAQVPTRPLYVVRPETDFSAALWLELRVLAQRDRFGIEQLVHVRNITAQVTTQRDTWTFHSMVMHKLNTPLQTMIGGLEMLSPQSISTFSQEEIGQLANFAHSGAQRLAQTINDILKYLEMPILARSGRGLDLAQLAALLTQISATLAINTELHLPTPLPARQLCLSARALESLFLELLENAKKFHPRQSPHVIITLQSLRPDLLGITICDDGISLPSDQFDRVWSPYYQGEKHFTGEQPGTGLGLAMVATLVWEAGGHCQLRNREDVPGVIVELQLPLQ